MLSHLLNRRAHMLFLGSQFWSWVQTLSDTYIKFIFKFSVFSLFLVLFYKISESWKILKNGLEFKHVCIHSAYLLLKQSPERNWELEIFRENTVYETVIGVCVCVCVCAQLCLTIWDPMDCSPPFDSVHGIFQASILEQVAIFSSRGSSWPRDWNRISFISCTGRWILYH